MRSRAFDPLQTGARAQPIILISRRIRQPPEITVLELEVKFFEGTTRGTYQIAIIGNSGREP
jgi:hypothetical protein